MDQKFYDQALRGLAHLYANHPKPVDIEPAQLAAPEDRSQNVSDTEYGTLKWLRDNGFIRAQWAESQPLQGPCRLAGQSAQLTPIALRLMETKEQNLGGRSIGEVAAANLTSDTGEWRYALETFTRKLVG